MGSALRVLSLVDAIPAGAQRRSQPTALERDPDGDRRELVFDFDGFASDNSLSFITGFGGTVKPRFVVRRTRPWYAALRAAKGRMDSLRALPRPGFLSRLSPKRGEARAG
jgi:hypothetical protein